MLVTGTRGELGSAELPKHTIVVDHRPVDFAGLQFTREARAQQRGADSWLPGCHRDGQALAYSSPTLRSGVP